MVNLEGMVLRLLETKGYAQSREAAKLLGISPADFSNRKKRGTLLPLLIEWAIHERVDLHWFITGEGTKRPNNGTDINPLLVEVNEWLNEEKKHKDADFEILFRKQMIRAFFDYEAWRERKEGKNTPEADYPASKVV